MATRLSLSLSLFLSPSPSQTPRQVRMRPRFSVESKIGPIRLRRPDRGMWRCPGPGSGKLRTSKACASVLGNATIHHHGGIRTGSKLSTCWTTASSHVRDKSHPTMGRAAALPTTHHTTNCPAQNPTIQAADCCTATTGDKGKMKTCRSDVLHELLAR